MTKRLVLGIDAGMNGVKVIGPKGEVYFRSLVIPEPPAMLKFGNELGIQNRFELEIDEQRFLLGEHAQFITMLNPMEFNSSSTGSKNDEDAYRKAIGGICRYIDSYEDYEDEDIEVYAVFGSPINSAADDDEVEEIEDRFLADDEPVEVIYNDIPLNIYFKDVYVVPEGVAANFAADFTGHQIVYICDAGSQNINLAALSGGQVIPTASGSLNNGVEYFKKMYQETAAKTLAQQIRSMMENLKWPKGITIYVAGGYAAELATAFNALKRNKYNMEVIKPALLEGRKTRELKPIYANAAGMYNIARKMYAKAPASKG